MPDTVHHAELSKTEPRGRQDTRWNDRGASLVEYAMLVALISVVCLAALSLFGGETDGSVNRSADRVIDASNG